MSNQGYFSAEYLRKNKSFFLTLFSIHFPFSEEELIQLKDILPMGSGGYSMTIDSGSNVIWADYGLAFNRNIQWTEELKEIYHKDSILLYAGAGQDEWFIVDFNQFPLNPEEEIAFARTEWLENDIKAFEFDDEGNGLSPMTDFGNELLNTDFSTASLEEIKKLITIYEQGSEMLNATFIFKDSFFERVKHFLSKSVSSFLYLMYV